MRVLPEPAGVHCLELAEHVSVSVCRDRSAVTSPLCVGAQAPALFRRCVGCFGSEAGKSYNRRSVAPLGVFRPLILRARGGKCSAIVTSRSRLRTRVDRFLEDRFGHAPRVADCLRAARPVSRSPTLIGSFGARGRRLPADVHGAPLQCRPPLAGPRLEPTMPAASGVLEDFLQEGAAECCARRCP